MGSYPKPSIDSVKNVDPGSSDYQTVPIWFSLLSLSLLSTADDYIICILVFVVIILYLRRRA